MRAFKFLDIGGLIHWPPLIFLKLLAVFRKQFNTCIYVPFFLGFADIIFPFTIYVDVDFLFLKTKRVLGKRLFKLMYRKLHKSRLCSVMGSGNASIIWWSSLVGLDLFQSLQLLHLGVNLFLNLMRLVLLRTWTMNLWSNGESHILYWLRRPKGKITIDWWWKGHLRVRVWPSSFVHVLLDVCHKRTLITFSFRDWRVLIEFMLLELV